MKQQGAGITKRGYVHEWLCGMSSTGRRSNSRRISVILVIVGLLTLVLYQLLIALEIGNFGEPADIGGGLIRLLGLILIVVGVIRLFVDFIRGRSNQRDF